MLEFFSKSFFFVSIYSLVRFFVGLLIARFLFPSDFATVLIPIILFGFLDMYIEGGYYSGILKKGITGQQEKEINKEQLKLVLSLGLIVFFSIIFFTSFNENREIPLLVTTAYFINSIAKVFTYTREAIFVASGKYIYVETISFFTSCFIYLITFLLIFTTDIQGFYYLCIWHLGFTISFACMIQYLGKKIYVERNCQLPELKSFSKINRNSSIIFTISGRLDELSAASIFSSLDLGIFSKLKELAIMIGTFSSKVISRPWFYVACNSPSKLVAFYHSFAISFILLSSWILFPLISIVINYVISLMGENWIELYNYSSYIIFIFIIYLTTEFTRCTLVASGGEDFVLRLEKCFLVLRFLLYPALIILMSFNLLVLSISFILFIELLVRILYFSIQSVFLISKFGKSLLFYDR